MQLETEQHRQSYPTLEAHQSNSYLESGYAIDAENSENKKSILKKIKKMALNKKEKAYEDEAEEKIVVVANVLQSTENQVYFYDVIFGCI